MIIYCCGCNADIEARLTDGSVIYPHRKDLHSLPFWMCDTCKNYVGCHHKTNQPTRPLGHIPTKEIRNARQHIHRKLDPLWESGRWKRRSLYAELSERLGYHYHTSEIKTLDEARRIYKIVQDIAALDPEKHNQQYHQNR